MDRPTNNWGDFIRKARYRRFMLTLLAFIFVSLPLITGAPGESYAAVGTLAASGVTVPEGTVFLRVIWEDISGFPIISRAFVDWIPGR